MEHLFPPKNTGKHERPHRDNRTMLNAVVWIARSGAPWRDLPDRRVSLMSWSACPRGGADFKRWISTFAKNTPRMSFHSHSTGSRFLPALTDTVYWSVPYEYIFWLYPKSVTCKWEFFQEKYPGRTGKRCFFGGEIWYLCRYKRQSAIHGIWLYQY